MFSHSNLEFWGRCQNPPCIYASVVNKKTSVQVIIIRNKCKRHTKFLLIQINYKKFVKANMFVKLLTTHLTPCMYLRL